jgi:CheY-like chemotaxis protein
MHLPPEMFSRRSPPARFNVLIMYEDLELGGGQRKLSTTSPGNSGMIWSSGTRCGGWTSCRSRNSTQSWGEVTKTSSDIINDANRLFTEGKGEAMVDPNPIVIVIDDDAAFRRSTERLIVSVGYKVQTFAAAGDFLVNPRPEAPACLLLDVRLPGLSDLDLQRELVTAGIQIPIIFITGHGDIPMSVQAMKACGRVSYQAFSPAGSARRRPAGDWARSRCARPGD